MRVGSPAYRFAHAGYETGNQQTTMVRYRRNFLPGAMYFFTVTLSDRRSNALVDHVGELRDAFRVARRERPFAVDATVILPDHLHAMFTLPPDDADFSGRWRRIKGHFSSALIDAGIELKRNANGGLALWQRRFWEHTIRNEDDFARHVDYVHFNPVREKVLPRDWAGDARQGGADFGERPDQ